MIVYRITLEKYSHQLFASGKAGRWNSHGFFVIYTASTRSLACLENIVHRSGEGLNQLFKTMVIDVPDNIVVSELTIADLPDDWQDYKNQIISREIGNKWVQYRESAILKVPSAIVSEEFNFLINPNHPDFNQIKLKKAENFLFDKRIYH